LFLSLPYQIPRSIYNNPNFILSIHFVTASPLQSHLALNVVNMLTVEKQWINVQQKTFTKWYFHPSPAMPNSIYCCASLQGCNLWIMRG